MNNFKRLRRKSPGSRFGADPHLRGMAPKFPNVLSALSGGAWGTTFFDKARLQKGIAALDVIRAPNRSARDDPPGAGRVSIGTAGLLLQSRHR